MPTWFVPTIGFILTPPPQFPSGSLEDGYPHSRPPMTALGSESLMSILSTRWPNTLWEELRSCLGQLLWESTLGSVMCGFPEFTP